METRTAARIGFWLGLVGGVVALGVSFVPLAWPALFGPAALRALAVAWVMACWWVSEAIPIPATSMLPLAAFPLLGVLDVKTAASAYADRAVLVTAVVMLTV